jgi:hypothetical protein
MEILLKVDDSKYELLLALLKTLDYVKIHEITEEDKVAYAAEPLLGYKKKSKPTVDEIEQLIIAKALRDAEAIEWGELETRDLDVLLAELENENYNENE